MGLRCQDHQVKENTLWFTSYFSLFLYFPDMFPINHRSYMDPMAVVWSRSPNIRWSITGWWFQPSEKYSSMERIIPYIVENRKMFETTNQIRFRNSRSCTVLASHLMYSLALSFLVTSACFHGKGLEIAKQFYWYIISPPARWGLLDFIRAVLLLLRLLLHLLLSSSSQSRSQWAQPDLHRERQIPVGTAGPPPRAQDPSGHCRTSTATSRLQWALPDLNRDFQIAVGTSGPQPRLPDRSGHCRTSTATSRSQWALPDLNRDFQIAVGTAGPQREEKMSDWMSEDMPDRMPDRMPERYVR